MRTPIINFCIIKLILISSFSFAQNNISQCRCDLLKENKINDEKVIQLAQTIETSFANVSADGFNEKFNNKSFLDLVVTSDNIDKNDAFTKGFISSIKDSGKALSKKILNEITEGAYYSLINYRYSVPDEAYYFTFRLYSNETGINYHDYKVCLDGEKLMFNDIYIYLTGEHLSDTFKRLLVMSKPQETTMSKFLKLKTDNGVPEFLKAINYQKKGDFKAAYQSFNAITGDMAKEKFILILKSLMASNFSDKLYEKSLEEFAAVYPNDPTLYMKQIDYYLLKEDNDKALECIDKLMYETDDDFLNIMKGNIYYSSLDYENAKNHYNYMVANYPDLFEGYVGMISCLTELENFEEAVNLTDVLIEKGYEKKVLTDFYEEKEPDGSNALEKLVASKVYKTWKKKK